MEEQMAAAPIKPIVPAVFVYVTDIGSSVSWYCDLLGLPVPEKVREDIHIFGLSEAQCSNIFLQRRDKVIPSSEPIFSLTAPDNEAAYQFLTRIGADIVHRDRDVIHFRDPDGNVLMACSI